MSSTFKKWDKFKKRTFLGSLQKDINVTSLLEVGVMTFLAIISSTTLNDVFVYFFLGNVIFFLLTFL